jgi:hypothetical protein
MHYTVCMYMYTNLYYSSCGCGCLYLHKPLCESCQSLSQSTMFSHMAKLNTLVNNIYTIQIEKSRNIQGSNCHYIVSFH